MMKTKLISIIKKIVFSIGIIYGINVILKNVGIFVPINIYTVGLTSMLGVPGLLSIFAILYLIK